MQITIRKTETDEFFQTENITRETFWNLYKPGCNEHLVLHQLRNSKSYICGFDLVAVLNNKIVGHIISSKARVVDSFENKHTVLCVGPLSVLPDYQSKGIGSQLLNSSITIARNLKYKGLILFGNPDYYHRFGFKNAAVYGISTKEGQNFEPFMALETQKNSLENITGRFYEDEAFSVDEVELTEFEKKFPFKKKRVTKTQKLSKN